MSYYNDDNETLKLAAMFCFTVMLAIAMMTRCAETIGSTVVPL